MKFDSISLSVLIFFILKPSVFNLSIVVRIEERTVQVTKEIRPNQSITKAELIREDDYRDQYGLSSDNAKQSLLDQDWYKNADPPKAIQKRCCGEWFMGQKSKRCAKPVFGGSTNGYIVATVGKRQCGGCGGGCGGCGGCGGGCGGCGGGCGGCGGGGCGGCGGGCGGCGGNCGKRRKREGNSVGGKKRWCAGKRQGCGGCGGGCGGCGGGGCGGCGGGCGGGGGMNSNFGKTASRLKRWCGFVGLKHARNAFPRNSKTKRFCC